MQVITQTSGQHDDEWGKPNSELSNGLISYRRGKLGKPDWDGWQDGELEAALVAQEVECYKRALFGLLVDIQPGSENQLCDILATVQKEQTLSEAIRSVFDRYRL
ncbi:uncharacterized protein P174DRAFT_501107 [Aspergillus novofumigatus IBT 16806]|uniref:Uncharacterized protein n=1 Tax=Aspergillus novofumigatus (strain IBT 16806) TaxID=1392255 RepID=A0A2I1CF55_ASPN1|nr:uncharacterized protein P174DRAFT_501107 [Aspergillus novofumigatus IBT 16806]PKX96266.1 hypothetical protein P174DRAFT_501107 [Aspergillus novofumigatus IBT 16806]